jgi:hypothetical protein
MHALRPPRAKPSSSHAHPTALLVSTHLHKHMPTLILQTLGRQADNPLPTDTYATDTRHSQEGHLSYGAFIIACIAPTIACMP